MIKVAWISRHKPLEIQVEKLREIFGSEVEIVQISRTFRNAEEILKELRELNIRYAVLVLPLSMIAVLTRNKDITWIWSEMVTVHKGKCKGLTCKLYNPKTDVLLVSNGEIRHLRFKGFKRIVKVELVFEPFQHLEEE